VRTLFICVAGVVCGVLASGCGYALAGRGSYLPVSIKTIGIPTFTNSTVVFNIETMLTEKVRREFNGRGKYKIVPDAADADAVLTGAVSSVTVAPASFSATQLASRYVITMTAKMELRDTKSNTVLWDNPSVFFRQEYEATSGAGPTDASAFFGHEANALERLSSEFARTIVSAILEAF
jgi:lipopolysaccharide assembly LptE-like protein